MIGDRREDREIDSNRWILSIENEWIRRLARVVKNSRWNQMRERNDITSQGTCQYNKEEDAITRYSPTTEKEDDWYS